MTTIAYHHGDKQIAVDSRTTSGGVILSDTSNKVRKLKGMTWYLILFKGVVLRLCLYSYTKGRMHDK